MTGASIAIVYGAGVVFAVSAGVLLRGSSWRTVSGQATDAELVMVQGVGGSRPGARSAHRRVRPGQRQALNGAAP